MLEFCAPVKPSFPCRRESKFSRKAAIVFSLRAEAGGSPAATHFLCFAKKSKPSDPRFVAPEKKTPGYPALLGDSHRDQIDPLSLSPRRTTTRVARGRGPI